MGKAERAAAERARRGAADAKRRDAEQANLAARARSEEHARIEALRIQALAVLRASGWPDGILIKPYGPFLTRKKAGWHAGDILTSMHGEAGSRPIYLLSNGRWSAPNDYEVSTLELLSRRRTSGIEDGLQGLIDRYG